MGFAGCAPYSEGHLESDDQSASCVEVARACAEGMFAGEFVAGGEAFLVRRDVSVMLCQLRLDYGRLGLAATNRPISGGYVSSCFLGTRGATTY